MDMDKASKHTDGYGWIAIKSVWIWLDMDEASLMDWIGLDGFPYVRVMRTSLSLFCQKLEAFTK